MKDTKIKNILVIFDSKISSKNQAVGLVESLKKKIKGISYDKFEVKKSFYSKFPNLILFFLYKYGLITLNQNLIKKYYVIISCGRITAPISLFLKQKTNSRIIHILNPYYKINYFDKVILPKHDKNSNKNIITINGSLVNEQRLKINNQLKKKFEKKYPIETSKKIIIILIGGNSKSYSLKPDDLNNFIKSLERVYNDQNKLVFLFSRRTPTFFREGLKNFFSKNCIICNDDFINPYWYFLKIANYIIVTSDSVSMTSEAIFTGKPVYIYYFKKSRKKIIYFHRFLEKEKITKRFNGKIKRWKNISNSENEKVAKQITRYLEAN